MKLVRPEEKQPKNVVQFKVPTAMTDYDIQNYLEKIYKIKVIKIESDIENGKILFFFIKYIYIINSIVKNV